MKGDAPLFSRPPSPEKDKKYVSTLEGIPEATPGPNAFAQQAARMDRHRLDGNAFYQQEVQKRKATPPTAVHPALRLRSSSDPPTPPRDSLCTTFSPFINAGKLQKHESPPLKLMPSDADLAVPTLRGIIEERHEQIQHERSGAPAERTPVFVPTPKSASHHFAKPAPTPDKRADKENSNSDVLSSKTPKKGFFGRLKLTTNLLGTASPSTNALDSAVKDERDENVPVKAQAVLGTSPSKVRKTLGSSASRTNLPRSPSKRKGFFSRKTADATEPNTATIAEPESAEQAPLTASSYVKTPPTAFSDPTHYSYSNQNKRNISQSNSNKGATKDKPSYQAAVTRSQSLKYFDHSVPPTPPAKNTPPNEKAIKEAIATKYSARPPFDHDSTLSKQSEGLVSVSGGLSPTRFGSCGHKDLPNLVTQPSVYSLRASVVPNLTDVNTFDEMKARIDGLGLEGFNMPQENVRSSKILEVYSPSMYSSDWINRPNSVLINGAPPVELPTKSPNAQSTHTKESSSSAGEIPIVYPELAKDPSIPSMSNLLGSHYRKVNQSDTQLEIRKPWHGCTHSLDHSSTNSPRPSVDSAIFAQHVGDESREKKKFDSPTSFDHPSAAPSPLHLPATTFKPPPRSTSKLGGAVRQEVKVIDIKSKVSASQGVRNDIQRRSVSPAKRNDVFENAPSLPARTIRDRTRSPSPQDSGFENDQELAYDVDPQKPSPKKSKAGDKFDRMIEILNKLNARNDEMSTIREEIRATNERLDHRLAAVENLHRASPAPSYALGADIVNEKSEGDSSSIRVPTDVARDFYQPAEQCEDSSSDQVNGTDESEPATIAELKETNRRLLEMVGGFAEKIEALEKRAGTQG